jgi:tRNA A37 methylthiotransferase MiaB
MKAYIWSNGCSNNRLDELHIQKLLSKNNIKLTTNPKEGDVIILNTCAVTSEKEDEVIEKILAFSKIKKNDAKMIIGGCFPIMNKKRLESVFQGPTFNPNNIDNLNSLLKLKITKIPELIPHDLSMMNDLRFQHSNTEEKFKRISSFFSINGIYMTFFLRQYLYNYFYRVFPLRVCTGCLGNCSYCSIKRVRGSLRSRPKNMIIKELKGGLKLGFNKFALIGEDVGAYGQDLKNENIITLLKALVKVKGNFKIIIRDVNPRWVIKYYEELIGIFDTNKISLITIPIQSASNKILKLMNRSYDIEVLRKYLIDIKKRFPKLKIITHIIVGFPNENEKDFEETLNFIKTVNFNFTYVYKFSCRPYTVAEMMKHQVPDHIKDTRVRKAILNTFLILFKNGFNY